MRKRLLQFFLPIMMLAIGQTGLQAQCALSISASDSSICAGDSTVLTANGPINAGSLTTVLAGGNNHRGNMFNIVAINSVTITSFDAHPMGNTDYAIYYKVGTHVGFETNSAAWTLVGTATGVVAQPFGTPTPLPIPVNITIPAGQTYAFYVSSTNVAVSQNYTNGTAVGNTYASDANIQFLEGTGQEYPFGSTFSPRIFNGVIHYATAGTYAWSTGATTQSITVSPLALSTYSCTINVPSISCTVSDSIDIAVAPSPSVNLGADTSVCAPGALTLDAGVGAAAYSWSTGDTTQTISANASASYVVTVFDNAGCSGSDTLALTMNPQPVVGLGNDTLLCPGSALSLDAGNAGATFAWSTGGNGQVETIAGGVSGPVSVAVTDGNGCVGTDTVMVSATVGVLDLGPDGLICDGQPVTLDAGAANTNWNWSTGDTSQTVNANTPGSVYASAMAPDGCLLNDTVSFVAMNSPVASFTATPNGLTVTLVDNSTDATAYAWDFGDGNTSTVANPTHTYAADGSYPITLVVTNGCGSDTATFNATVVGVEDALPFTIGVFPNPNQGSFSLQVAGIGAGNLEITLADLSGKVVFRSLGVSNSGLYEQVIHSNLTQGTYLLSVSSDSRKVVHRVVVQ